MKSSQNSSELCTYWCSAHVELITGQGLRFVQQGQHFMGHLGRVLAQHWVHQHSMREEIITQKKNTDFSWKLVQPKKLKVTHPCWFCLTIVFPHVAVFFCGQLKCNKSIWRGECCRWVLSPLRCGAYVWILSLLGTGWRAHAQLSVLFFMFSLVVFHPGTEWADKTPTICNYIVSQLMRLQRSKYVVGIREGIFNNTHSTSNRVHLCPLWALCLK